jgi:hypothetical protein
VKGIDARLIAERIDDVDVVAEYQRHRMEARSAERSAAHAQGKTSTSDGHVRFTAPSVVFKAHGGTLVAGGWQPLLAYDVLLANLDPRLERMPPASSPEALLDYFDGGLVTAEVALLLADGADPVPDRDATDAALRTLLAEGKVERKPLGTDALWVRA